MFEEFKKFALKGNVIDMAVGIIIGAAFTRLVSSLVDDILMPPLGILIGRVDFSNLSLTLQKKTEAHPEVILKYGQFINTTIDFLLLSFVIFLVIKQMNRLTKKEEKQTGPDMKACPQCCSQINIHAVRCPMCTAKIT